jgi:hypothetical protein
MAEVSPSPHGFLYIARLLGLTLLGAGLAGVGAGVATVLVLSSPEPEQDIAISIFQGLSVFVVLLIPFAGWGRSDEAGWAIPVVGVAIIVSALFWVSTPLLLEQSEGLFEVCEQVVEDAGMMFPVTTSVAKDMGWLAILLFPFLIVTFMVDLVIMVVAVPFILLMSPIVWAAGGGLLALEAALVLVGSIGGFVVMSLLRRQLLSGPTEG